MNERTDAESFANDALKTAPPPLRNFSYYFRMEEDVESVTARFGYGYGIARLQLPHRGGTLEFVPELQRRLERAIPRVSMASEISKREFLVAPILFELIQHFEIKTRSEFVLRVNDLLGGTLDYLIEGTTNLVVITAKQDDLYRGGRQLAAELISVDQWMKQERADLYGALTIGSA